MISKKTFQKHIDSFEKTCEKRHDPFEKYLNEILQKEIAISVSYTHLTLPTRLSV